MALDRSRPAAVALRYRCMQLWRRSQRGETSTLTHPVRGSWPSVDRLLLESAVALDADWLTLASDHAAWRALPPVWKERWMPQPGGTDLFGRALHLPGPGLPWPSLSRVGELPVALPALGFGPRAAPPSAGIAAPTTKGVCSSIQRVCSSASGPVVQT